MTHLAKLIADIEAYCSEVGMSESTFGRKAVNDGKFVGRLRLGKRCWPETEERARSFIRRDGDAPTEEAA